MITDILFDLGGVIIDLDTEGMQKACIRNGIDMRVFFVPADANSTSTVCQGVAASDLIADYQIGLISTEQMLERALQYCPGKSAERFIDTWNACLNAIPKERLDMIKELRAHGYRVHLLSNTNDLHWRHVDEHFFQEPGYTTADLFDCLFLSHEMHASKPCAEIYEQVIATIRSRHGADIQPENMIFFDDTEVNALAARHAGMQAEWLDLSKEDILALIRRTL